MQNGGNVWQQRKERFNRNNEQDGNRVKSHNNTSGGNWVQQKNQDEKRNTITLGSKKSKVADEMLVPPPAPPKLSTPVQSRLGGKFRAKTPNSGGSNKKRANITISPPKDNDKMNTSNLSNSGSASKDWQGYNKQNRGSNRVRGSGGGYYNIDRIKDRVNRELSGPQYDLPPLSTEEKQFNSQCRLFIGNISREANPDDLKEEFAKYGDVGQAYFNKESSYGFITFDYKRNADKAVSELQGKLVCGRSLTVRFATVNSGIKVKNLSPSVSNELLEKAFNVFGIVETSRVTVDGRGKPTGEGIIIFSEKKSASIAIKKCEEDCFFLTSSLRPVVVELLEARDEGEGQPEVSMNKNEAYRKEREIGPHFADAASFQYEYGLRWKQLFYLFNEKKTALERDFQAECDALAAKLSLAKHEYETDQLRRELAQREAESSYLHAEAEYRMNTASFSTFHGSGSGTGMNSSFDNTATNKSSFDRFDSSGGQFSNFNRNSFGFDNNKSANQTFDNSFNQGNNQNFDQTYNSNSNNADMNSAPAAPTLDNTLDEIIILKQSPSVTATTSKRLAGRLQDLRTPEQIATDEAMARQDKMNTTTETPQSREHDNNGSLDMNRSLNMEDLNRSLSGRQNHGDLNRSLNNRQDAQDDLSRSLNNRHESMGDLNRSLSRRQDRQGQGDQAIKRIRY